MSYYLPKTSIILSLIILFSILLLAQPKTVTAEVSFVFCDKVCWKDPVTGDYTDCWNGLFATSQFICSANKPPTYCSGPNDIPPWTLHFNPTCTQANFPCTRSEFDWEEGICDPGGQGIASCDWSQNNCSAVDRCDTGYNRASPANSYKVYAGQCSALAYDGSNPASACVTGGQYKVCCTGGETYQNSTPQGWCDVIPYTRTCNPGAPTGPGVLSCPVSEPAPSPSPTPVGCTPGTWDFKCTTSACSSDTSDCAAEVYYCTNQRVWEFQYPQCLPDTCGSSCGGGPVVSPTPTPAPGPSPNQLAGRIFIDANGSGGWDGGEKFILDPPPNPGPFGGDASSQECENNTANNYIAGGFRVVWSRQNPTPISGSVPPERCNWHENIIAAYYNTGDVIPDGYYDVSLTVPPGWEFTTPNLVKNVDLYNVSVNGVWFGVRQPPACTVDLLPASFELPQGDSQSMVAGVTATNGTVDEVHFSTSNSSVVSVNPEVDNSYSYTTSAKGEGAGQATVTSAVHMSSPGYSHVESCQDSSSVTVTPPGPWYQTKDGDVWSALDVKSKIPSTCTAPSCTNKFSLKGDGGFPGVVVYGKNGTYSFGSGSVSEKGWLAQSDYSGKLSYKYDDLKSLAPPEVFALNSPGAISDDEAGNFNIIQAIQANRGWKREGREHFWFYRNGSLTLGPTTNLGDRKVVIFVKDNLTIGNNLTLNKGKGFFMAVVGGNIIIDNAVKTTGQLAPDSRANPALEGIFLANGTISTGSGDKQLYGRGMFVSWSRMNFQRDLSDDSETPAEFYEFAPDLLFTYPRELARRGIVWREVAP